MILSLLQVLVNILYDKKNTVTESEGNTFELSIRYKIYSLLQDIRSGDLDQAGYRDAAK